MAGIMASAVLAGCTNEPAPSSASQAEAGKDSAAGTGAPAASGDQITLRFMWWGGDERNEATLAVIDQYQKLHPEVRIEAEMNSHEPEVHRGLADLKGILSVYLDLDTLVAAAVAGASAPVIPPV